MRDFLRSLVPFAWDFFLLVGRYLRIDTQSVEVFGHNYNYKCDVWACGVIMYFLLILGSLRPKDLRSRVRGLSAEPWM